MSDKKIHLRIVTPDRTVFSAPVDEVGALGSEGAFTALPGHIEFLTDLQPGVLWYSQAGNRKELAVSGGFIEIRPDYAGVLADSADYVDEIDVERAARALRRAEEMLARAKEAGQSGLSDGARAEITASLTRAAVRLKLAVNRLPR